MEYPATSVMFRSKPEAPSLLTVLRLCSFSGLEFEQSFTKVPFVCCLSLQWVWTRGGCQGTNKLLPYADPEIANLITFMSMHLIHSTEWTFEPQKFRTDSHLGCFKLCYPSLRQRMQNGLTTGWGKGQIGTRNGNIILQNIPPHILGECWDLL